MAEIEPRTRKKETDTQSGWGVSIGVRDGGSGGQLTPQFGQIYDIYSGKRQHICLTNCVTPNGTSIRLPS